VAVGRRRVRFSTAGVFLLVSVDNHPLCNIYTGGTARRRLGAMACPRSSSLIFGDKASDHGRRLKASTASGARWRAGLPWSRAVWQVNRKKEKRGRRSP